jgi:hypothetical protein
MIGDIFDLPLPRKVKAYGPIYRAIRLGMKAGELVGTKAGERTALRIAQKGAATGPVFTKEMFEYEISAIRMGAQI